MDKKVFGENETLDRTADMIRKGYISGFDPFWDLTCPHALLLSEREAEKIATMVSHGFTFGVEPIHWQLSFHC